MHSLTNLKAKLKELDDIEKDVAQALHAAGQALTELGKSSKPALLDLFFVKSHRKLFFSRNPSRNHQA